VSPHTHTHTRDLQRRAPAQYLKRWPWRFLVFLKFFTSLARCCVWVLHPRLDAAQVRVKVAEADARKCEFEYEGRGVRRCENSALQLEAFAP